MKGQETIDNNKYTSHLDLAPYHDAHDKEKLRGLTKSMEEDGWVGSPLCKVGSQLLTGSHRYKAACKVGMQYIPVVDFQDVFAISDEEFEEIVDEECWEILLSEWARMEQPELANLLGIDIQ